MKYADNKTEICENDLVFIVDQTKHEDETKQNKLIHGVVTSINCDCKRLHLFCIGREAFNNLERRTIEIKDIIPAKGAKELWDKYIDGLTNL